MNSNFALYTIKLCVWVSLTFFDRFQKLGIISVFHRFLHCSSKWLSHCHVTEIKTVAVQWRNYRLTSLPLSSIWPLSQLQPHKISVFVLVFKNIHFKSAVKYDENPSDVFVLCYCKNLKVSHSASCIWGQTRSNFFLWKRTTVNFPI